MPPTNRTVARPNIELRAENAQLQRDVDKLTKRLERQLARGARRGGRRFDQALRSAITRPLAGLVATVGAAFTGAALLRGVRSFANAIGTATTSIDDLTKAAERLGVDAGGLQTLGLVANEAGASFENLERGVARFTANLGDAINGVGTASNAFATLGLDAQALAAQSLVEQLAAVDAALVGLPTAQAAALRNDLFGTGGRQLANVIGTGRLQVQVGEVGGFLDRIGARVRDTDRASNAALIDAGNRLRVAFEALAASVAVQLTPSLTRLAERLTEQVGELARGVQAGDIDIVGDMRRLVDNFTETLGRLQLEFARTGGTLQAVNRAWERAADAFGIGATALDYATYLLPIGFTYKTGASVARGFTGAKSLLDIRKTLKANPSAKIAKGARREGVDDFVKGTLGTLGYGVLGIGSLPVIDKLGDLGDAIRQLGQSAEAIEKELEARYAEIDEAHRNRAETIRKGREFGANEEATQMFAKDIDKRVRELFMGDDGVNALRARLRQARDYETFLKDERERRQTREALAQPIVGPVKDFAGSFPALPTIDIGDKGLFDDLLDGLASAREEGETFINEFDAGIKRIKSSLEDSRAFVEPFANARRELEDLREATLDFGGINPERGEQLATIESQLKRLDVANVRELKYELEDVAQSLIPTNDRFIQLRVQLEAIKNSKFGPALREEIDAIEDRMSIISSGVADVWQASVNRMGSAIDQMIDGASLSFRDFTAALLRDWAKVIARVTLFGSDGTSGILGSVFGSLIGGLGGLFKGPVQAEVGPGFDFGSFASGGQMPANKLALVGEKGPELLLPSQSHYVVNNMRLKELAKRSDDVFATFDRGDNYDNSRVEHAINQISKSTARQNIQQNNNTVNNHIQAGVNAGELAFAMTKVKQDILNDLVDLSGGRAEFARAMRGGGDR